MQIGPFSEERSDRDGESSVLSDHQRVVVTGVGAVTPVGNDVPTMWDNLVAGRSGVDKITGFDASQLKVQIAAEVKGFDPQAYMLSLIHI